MTLRTLVAAAAMAAAAAQATFRYSHTLGSNMVLQRDQPAVVWGFGSPGATVSTVAFGSTFKTIVGADGIWRQQLPPQSASATPVTITSSSSAGGGSISMSNVLVGDVYICGGQSNMEFTLDSAFNASVEVARTASYPNIRVMTVGEATTSATPLTDLATLQQPWAVASPASIGAGNWTAFSAVCWLFGRNVYDGLGGSVPIGLISSNWGGTRIQAWSTASANAACNTSAELSEDESLAWAEERGLLSEPVGAEVGPGQNNATVLWNAMIVPFTTGPLALKGFTWFQGEANSGDPTHYACSMPALISLWRGAFKAPGAFFGLVQLEPWIAGGGNTLARFRDAQLAALALPGVGYATAIDIGDPTGPFGSVHPRAKQLVGARLAAAALNLAYGQSSQAWKSPTVTAVDCTTTGTAVTCALTFDAATIVGGLQIDAGGLHAICPTWLGVPASICAYPAIQMADGSVLNATLALTAGGTGATISGVAAKAGLAAAAVSYGYGTWPVTTLFSLASITTKYETVTFPALTFNLSVSSATVLPAPGVRGGRAA